MDFLHKVSAKYTTEHNDVTYAKKVMALVDAVTVFITPYPDLVAGHVGGGTIKVVKESEWFMPSPSLKLSGDNRMSVIASNGTEVHATDKIDEALSALDQLLLEYVE